MDAATTIDAATQHLLTEQLCKELTKSALPKDAQPYGQLFAQVLADATNAKTNSK